LLNVILKLFENVFVLFDANKMEEKKWEKMRQKKLVSFFLFSKFVSQPIRGLPLLGTDSTKQIYK